MNDPAERALARLRADDAQALAELATLVVTEATETQLSELASSRWIASQIATALKAATRGDNLKEAVQHRLDRASQRYQGDSRPLREVVPSELLPPLQEVLGRPFTPPRRLTERVVQQRAMRDLVSKVLEDTVSRFGRRMRATDDKLGGLGRRASSRGRALGKGLLAAAGVADAASDLVHAVSEEFEAALERRVKDFLGDATSRALTQIVDQLSDPDRAEAMAEFRLGLLEEILDTPIQELVEDLDGLDPVGSLDVIVEALRGQVDRADFIDRTEARVQQALAEAGDGTLGAWLSEVDLRDVWIESTTELLTARLQAIVHGPGFERWWASLFE